MKILVKKSQVGIINLYSGQTVDVEPRLGQSLCKGGYAEPAGDLNEPILFPVDFPFKEQLYTKGVKSPAQAKAGSGMGEWVDSEIKKWFDANPETAVKQIEVQEKKIEKQVEKHEIEKAVKPGLRKKK